MKVLIVYDSKYGNNREIANFIAEKLRNAAYEVKVSYAKEISLKDALAFHPEIFLFGGPIHIGMISFTIKRWVSRFASLLSKKKIKLTKAAIWGTHGDTTNLPEKYAWKNLVVKWEQLLAKVPAVKTLSGMTDFYVAREELSLESGWQTKITEFVERVLNL